MPSLCDILIRWLLRCFDGLSVVTFRSSSSSGKSRQRDGKLAQPSNVIMRGGQFYVFSSFRKDDWQWLRPERGGASEIPPYCRRDRLREMPTLEQLIGAAQRPSRSRSVRLALTRAARQRSRQALRASSWPAGRIFRRCASIVATRVSPQARGSACSFARS